MSESPAAIAPDLLERRDFTMQLILAVLSSATIVVSDACGSSGLFANARRRWRWGRRR